MHLSRATVRLSVRLSVCPMSGIQLLQVCCVARAAGDIDRLLHGAQQAAARANVGNATLSAYVGGSTQVCCSCENYTRTLVKIGEKRMTVVYEAEYFRRRSFYSVGANVWCCLCLRRCAA